MKTQYQYIHFVKIADRPKTSVWSCRNTRNGDELGEVKWYAAWRQYCYLPTQPAIYSVGCLADIENFIKSISSSQTETAQLTNEKQSNESNVK